MLPDFGSLVNLATPAQPEEGQSVVFCRLASSVVCPGSSVNRVYPRCLHRKRSATWALPALLYLRRIDADRTYRGLYYGHRIEASPEPATPV